jgi:chemotaxis signal transduction protein
MTQTQDTLLCFRIAEMRFAISINAIKTVIRSVAVTPVPEGNNLIQGMMDFRGKIIPVINLRPRFNLPEKKIDINQQFIIVKNNSRRLVIIADTVEELITTESLEISTVEMPFNPKQQNFDKFGLEVMQFFSDKQGIIVIYDIEKLIGTEGILEIESFFNHREK